MSLFACSRKIICLNKLSRDSSKIIRKAHNFTWAGTDLNRRRPKSSDLQSDAFDRSATDPILALIKSAQIFNIQFLISNQISMI